MYITALSSFFNIFILLKRVFLSMTCEDIVPTEQYPHISSSQIFYKKGEKLSFRKVQINTPTLQPLFNKVTDP